MGPKTLVVKKGEHGVLMFTEQGAFAAPAYPLEEVFDPTGAGDTFAGGFLGYLAGARRRATRRRCAARSSWAARWRRSAWRRSASTACCASTRAEIDERFRLFKRLTHFETIE